MINKTNDEIIEEAVDRYLKDVVFVNIVNHAVLLMTPKVSRWGLQNALNEAATSAAAVAIVIFEEVMKNGTNGASGKSSGSAR